MEMEIFQNLDALRAEFQGELESISNLEELKVLRAKFLGSKGRINVLLKELKLLPPEDRRSYGKALNQLKGELRKYIEEKERQLKERARYEELRRTSLDLTAVGRLSRRVGSYHPLTIVIRELKEVFRSMGFEVLSGPELETEYYNFDALNIPSDHPARDMWDSFWIDDRLLLRTHTSPVQIRVMERKRPPLQVVSVGKCYRRDNVDATHSFQFYQIEGFMVDKGISFKHLRGVLLEFAKRVFGRNRKIRLTPSYFPFTEPSAEVAIDCFRCGGTDSQCPLCKGEGWIEILGAGMIHPKVLERVNISPEEWSGFAFGMGIERIAMLKYEIDDIRLFYENRLEFLEQWSSVV